jgi:hypothetical protein
MNNKRDPTDLLYRKRDQALDRVLRICDQSPAGSEELNTALDVLTLAHTALTFNFVSGT